jgi:hypothetical protein
VLSCALLGRFSHFLERARLDLRNAIMVKFRRQVFQRRGFIGQMSRLEDATFAVV